MRKNRKKSLNPTPPTIASHELNDANCFQGEKLTDLVQKLRRGIQKAEQLRGGIPEKIWLKQQFSIGVNDVTRALERMPRSGTVGPVIEQSITCNGHKTTSVQLQVILLAADCTPRWLTKHIPILASSRGVPVLFVRDNKGGSLRLGELMKLKTALAVGIKGRGGWINEVVNEVLKDWT